MHLLVLDARESVVLLEVPERMVRGLSGRHTVLENGNAAEGLLEEYDRPVLTSGVGHEAQDLQTQVQLLSRS